MDSEQPMGTFKIVQDTIRESGNSPRRRKLVRHRSVVESDDGDGDGDVGLAATRQSERTRIRAAEKQSQSQERLIGVLSAGTSHSRIRAYLPRADAPRA